jgi:LytS/YehU family sensor histidine kinase
MIDYIYTGLFIAPMMIIVYLNQGLLNYCIKRRQLWICLIGIPLLLGLGVALHYFSFDQLSDLLFSGYYLTSYYTVWEVTQYCAIFLIVTSLLKLAQDWFQIKDRELNLIKENHQAQLSSLKSQINPHFLFNSLNNIYAISGDKPDAVRKYIVKLSDALRYMIYETDEKEVPLQEEINYLKDYIALEQLRMNDPNSVQFSHPENTSELIAPLILLPIVENCFKHCNKQSPDIEISIELKETNLQLIASNAIVKTVKSDQNTGGLGLENLEKRLSLLYPDRHKLTVQVADYSYRTTLMIDLRV